MRVKTSRKAASICTLTLDSVRQEDGEWVVQDAGVFRPWKSIMIEAVFGTRVEEVMRGTIREVRVDNPIDMSATTVTVTGQNDEIGRLSGNRRREIRHLDIGKLIGGTRNRERGFRNREVERAELLPDVLASFDAPRGSSRSRVAAFNSCLHFPTLVACTDSTTRCASSSESSVSRNRAILFS